METEPRRIPESAMALIGTYRFVFSEDMRAHWAERLRKESPEEFEAALAAVEAEAAVAQIEITATGDIISRAGENEFYRAPLREEAGVVCFDKPNGARVVLRQPVPTTILADEPGKPQMRFERVVAV